MSRLTRKQSAAIARALRNAERAQAYLQRADIAVGKLNGFASTTLHYTRADGSTFYAIDKQIGSDLCGLQNCIAELRAFLNPQASYAELSEVTP